MLAFSADLSARPAASRFLHPSTQIPPSTIITLRLTAPRILSPHPPSALNSAHYRNLQSLDKKKKTTSDGHGEGDSDDDADEDLCPVDCVKEFRTNAELSAHLEAAKLTDSLVVVDFYRTACGSCKYIEQGFVKLCKGAGDHADAVIFLKHNVSLLSLLDSFSSLDIG
jgi:thiol-disulfide isomerase/thioredoxin